MSFFNRAKCSVKEYFNAQKKIPPLLMTAFCVSVIAANLMANKELLSVKYLALDCGFAFSWIMFLCMDVICRQAGAKASIASSVTALLVNLCITLSFALLTKAPGMWGAFYDVQDEQTAVAVNNALNATFGGSWYVVLGSALAFLCSSIINAFLNIIIGNRLKKKGFKEFAVRSYISTIVAQFADNFIFATVVSKIFFGWTWTQVIVCSLTGAVCELLCEVLFSGLGYKIAVKWEKESE